jgi:hypothetical protein
MLSWCDVVLVRSTGGNAGFAQSRLGPTCQSTNHHMHVPFLLKSICLRRMTPSVGDGERLGIGRLWDSQLCAAILRPIVCHLPTVLTCRSMHYLLVGKPHPGERWIMNTLLSPSKTMRWAPSLPVCSSTCFGQVCLAGVRV